MASGSGSGPGPVSFVLGCAGIILVLSIFVPIGIAMENSSQQDRLAARAAIEATALRYTFADAHLSGSVSTTTPGMKDASGTPYAMEFILGNGGTATFNVTAPQAGIYNLIVSGDSGQTVDVSVNNGIQFPIHVGQNLGGTTSWQIPIRLNNGSNTIVLSNQAQQDGACYEAHGWSNCFWISGLVLYPVTGN